MRDEKVGVQRGVDSRCIGSIICKCEFSGNENQSRTKKSTKLTIHYQL